MGDDHHAQPLFCQLPEEPAHLQHVGVVQAAGGFVEDQQLFSAEAAVHNGQTLLLPAALSLAGGWLSEHLYQYLLLSGGLHPFWMLIICGLFYCAFFMSIQCLVERFAV